MDIYRAAKRPPTLSLIVANYSNNYNVIMIYRKQTKGKVSQKLFTISHSNTKCFLTFFMLQSLANLQHDSKRRAGHQQFYKIEY